MGKLFDIEKLLEMGKSIGIGKLTSMIKPSTGYQKDKTFNKLAVGMIGSVIIAAITYGIQCIEGANIDPKYSLLVGFGITCLYGAQNAAKHWRDKELEESN